MSIPQFILHKFNIIALLALSIGMFFFEASGGHQTNYSYMVLAYIAGWIGIILYATMFFKSNGDAFLTSLYQLLYFFGILIGATFASFGAYMYEIRSTGTANGVFWFLIIVFLVTSESLQVGFKFATRIKHNNTFIISSRFDTTAIKFAIGIIVAVSFSVLLKYGSPILLGVTRTNYWGEAAPAGLSFLRILIVLTFFWVSALCLQPWENKRGSTFGKLSVALYVFLGIFLLGEKFSLFIMYLSAWLFVYAAKSNRVYPVKTICAILVFILAMVMWVSYQYEIAGLGALFIFTRLALQAQLPWSTLNETNDVLLYGAIFRGEKVNFLSLRETVSDRYVPIDIQAAHEASGTTLSGYLPSWTILTMGAPLTLISLSLFAFLLGMIQFNIVNKLRNKNLISAFLIFTAHFFLLSLWYIGNFNVFKIIFLLFLFFVVVGMSPRKKA